MDICALLIFLCRPTTIEIGPLPLRIEVHHRKAGATQWWKSYNAPDFRIDPETQLFTQGDKKFRNPSRFGMISAPGLRTHLDESCNQVDVPSDEQRLGWKLLEQYAEPLPNGAITWRYDFALNYLNLVMLPGWNSAYAQAVNTNALLFAECKTKDPRYLDLALRAADALVTPMSEGGLLNTDNGMTFFEEIPAPPNLAPHILNANILSINVLYAAAAHAPRFKRYADSAAQTLQAMLPAYEEGNCIRYDLKEPRRCPASYIAVNAMLLDDLSEWTGNVGFKKTAERWRKIEPSATTDIHN